MNATPRTRPLTALERLRLHRVTVTATRVIFEGSLPGLPELKAVCLPGEGQALRLDWAKGAFNFTPDAATLQAAWPQIEALSADARRQGAGTYTVPSA